MTTTTSPRAAGPTTRLPRAVFKCILALAALLVGASWVFFDAGHHAGLTLGVATAFVLFIAAIALVLRRLFSQRSPPGAAEPATGWLGRDFETWQYRLKGSEAVANVLLPIAAVAIGMMIFAIEYAVTIG